MQPQTLINLLPFITALASAAPVNTKRADLSDFCTVIPQAADTAASITCNIPGLTDTDIDAFYANLDPNHCTRTASGIECSFSASSSNKVKRSIADIVAFPIVIGSSPAGLEKRQSSTIVTIPKDLLANTVLDKGIVIGSAGNPVGIDVEASYKYGGFKLGKPADLEQLGSPAVLVGGGLTLPAGGLNVPVVKPVVAGP